MSDIPFTPSEDEEINLNPIEVTETENLFSTDKVVADIAVVDSFNNNKSLAESLSNKDEEVISHTNREEFSKPSVDDHLNNRNRGLEFEVNKTIFKTNKDVIDTKNFYEKDKKEVKESYSLDEINEVKKEAYQHVGNNSQDPKSYLANIYSDAIVNNGIEYLADEKLNDLIDEAGLVNKVSSLGSVLLGAKPIFEYTLDDLNIFDEKKRIAEYNSIHNEEEKTEFLRNQVERIWEDSNENEYIARFILSNYSNPTYDKDMTDEVLHEIIETVALGGVSDALGVFKIGVKSLKGVKNISHTAANTTIKKLKGLTSKSKDDLIKKIKESKVDPKDTHITEKDLKIAVGKEDYDAYLKNQLDFETSDIDVKYKKPTSIATTSSNNALVKRMRQSLKKDPISTMEQVGNKTGVVNTITGIITEAKTNPNILATLKRYSGLDEDDLFILGTVNNKKELDSLLLTRPHLLENYETVEALQKTLRTLSDGSKELNLQNVIDEKVARDGVLDIDKKTFETNYINKRNADVAKAIRNYNEDIDLDLQIVKQRQEDLYIEMSTEVKSEKLDNLLREYPELVTKETIKLNINAVQPFAVVQSNVLHSKWLFGKSYLMSPASTLQFGIKKNDGMISSLVDELTALDNQTQVLVDKVRPKVLNVNKSYNKLNKKQRVIVNQALKEGDEFVQNGYNVGKDFTYNELKNKGMDKQSIEAFFKFRILSDEMLSLLNEAKYREAKLKGYHQYEIKLSPKMANNLKQGSFDYKIASDDSLGQVGVEITKFEDIKKVQNQYADSHIIVEGEQDLIPFANLTDKDLDGFKLVRFIDNMGIDEQPVRFALTKSKSGELPRNLIQRRKGWIPRKYEARHYIYKKNKYGQDEVVSAVERAGDIAPEKLRLVNKGETGELFVRREGQDTSGNTIEDSFSQYDIHLEGNLNFSQSQRKSKLLVTANGDRVRTKNPFEALAEQVQATASAKPMAEYKAVLIKRAEETMNELIRKTGNSKLLKNNSNVLEGVADEFKNDYKEYQDLIDYVNKTVINPKDPAFETYSNFMRQVVDLTDETAGKFLPTKLNEAISQVFTNDLVGLFKLEDTNPLKLIKTINFVRLLGVLDPRQLFMQSLQTIAVVSISPKNGTTGIVQYMLYKAMRKNFRKNPEALSSILKKADIDKAELDYAILDLQDSNIMSAVKGDADLTLQNYGVFSKTATAGKNAIDTSMKFYDLGNEVVYATAFFTARLDVVGKISRRLTRREMELVQERVNTLAYNYTSANRAGFQRGVSSLMTQFLQVPAKSLESVFNSQFTSAEKLRLLAGQAAFFGTAGVPAGKEFANYISKIFETGQADAETNYEQEIINFENGIVGSVLSGIFGYDVSSENLKFFSTDLNDIPFYDLFTKVMSGDVVSSAKIIAEGTGASYDSVVKGKSILSRTYNMIETFALGDIEQSALLADQLFYTGGEVWKYTSTGNRLYNAVAFYKTGQKKDKYGNITVQYDDDEKAGVALGTALGFTGVKQAESYIYSKQVKMFNNKEEAVKDEAESWFRMAYELENFKATKQAFVTYCDIQGYSADICIDIWNTVGNKIINEMKDTRTLSEKNREKLLTNIVKYEDPDLQFTDDVRKLEKENIEKDRQAIIKNVNSLD